MNTQIIDLYKKLLDEDKHPEFEIRIFDGFGKMDLTEDNYNALFELDIFNKQKDITECSLTFSRYDKRVEIPISNKNTPIIIVKKRLKNINRNEIGVRLSLSLETPSELNANDMKETKFFRYRIRTSRFASQLEDWRFDFTKVHQVSLPVMTPVSKILKDIEKSPPTTWKYEVEVEYTGDGNEMSSDIDMISTILTDTVKRSPINHITHILNRYANRLMNQPVSLTLDDVHELSTGYSVTEKADGQRMLLYIDKNIVYESNRTRTGFCVSKLTFKGNKRITLLDTEYIEELDLYLLFDIMIYDGENITNKLLTERYEILTKNFTKGWPSNVCIKYFYFPGNSNMSIYDASKKIYTKKYDYYVDGLIYTPINKPYYNKVTYKWKPPKDLTLDLLIREPLDNLVVNKDGQYKIVQLYFMITLKQWKQHYMRNKDMMELTKLMARTFGFNRWKLPQKFPFPFAPGGDTKPFYAKIKVKEIDLTKYNDEISKFANFKDDKLYIAEGVTPMIPILDNMVIEFAYDLKAPNHWIPYRFRKDKTEIFLKGLQMGKFNRGPSGPNGWNAVMSNWDLIHSPVTKEIIFGDVALPEKYYKKTRNIAGKTGMLAKYMYKFNNHVKRELYKKYINKGDRVMEIAGGRGGDLDKALQQGAIQIVLIDSDPEALKEAERRSNKMKWGKNAQIDFLQYDLNKNVIADIEGIIDNKMNVVSCQFAFHYFLKDLKSLKNIAKLIDHFLIPSGYFLFTGLDGRTIFDLLKKEGSNARIEKNDEIVANITKLYDGNRMKSYGQEIEVYIEKIGVKHKEYLLNFKTVIKHFEKMGYKLIETEFFLLDTFSNSNKLSEAEISYAGMNRYAVLQKE